MNRLALITGVGRRNSIAYAVAQQLASDGWDLLLNYWHSYDDRLELPRSSSDLEELAQFAREQGVNVELLPANLEDPSTPQKLIDHAEKLHREQGFGELTGLVLSHCESVDSDVFSTTVESWDRHYAVNVRANWLLIKAFAESADTNPQNLKRVVALTSDHTAHNLPYGSSKGALDRLVIASGIELGARGFRCNLINPGPINTGWMDEATEQYLAAQTPAGHLGKPQDTADLISFLFSDAGGWINSQLLHSNGGFGAK